MQIYTKRDGTIDFLSLTNDSTVINKRNMRQVREHSAAMRLASEASLIDHSSLGEGIGSIGQHSISDHPLRS